MTTFLENENIKLRALEPEDLDVVYEWENDTQLWHLGGTMAPYSRYELKQYILSTKDIYEAKQLRLIIEKKFYKDNSSTVTLDNGDNDMPVRVGLIDLYDFDPHNRRAAIGILIDKAFQMKGLAGEALSLLCKYAFSFLKIHQLYAYIPVKNEPSVKLFSRHGFAKRGQLPDWVQTDDGYEDVLFVSLISDL